MLTISKVRRANNQAVPESKARVRRSNYCVAMNVVGMSECVGQRRHTACPDQSVMVEACDRVLFSRRETEKGRCIESVEEGYVPWVLEQILEEHSNMMVKVMVGKIWRKRTLYGSWIQRSMQACRGRGRSGRRLFVLVKS